MKFKIKGLTGRERYYADAREVTREEFDRLMDQEKACLPQVGEPEDVDVLAGLTNRPWAKPIESVAMQVHPRQIEQARERNARHGVNVDYTPKGKPVLRSRQDRNALMKVERMRDHDAGYSDRAGR